ncbi:MAG: hypothetical protein ABW321_27770 [Polyangiales bacterium]
MIHDVTSRHLHGTTELTLLAPIRSGFIETSEVMTYATRLRLLLETGFKLRQISAERDLRETGSALEALQTIQFTHWAVLGPEQELHPAKIAASATELGIAQRWEHKLLFTVTFDRSWEEYIHIIVDHAGPILDLMFSHCVGYEEHACRDGYEAFEAWVRRHQLQFHAAYAATPELSVDDVRYLRKLGVTHANQVLGASRSARRCVTTAGAVIGTVAQEVANLVADDITSTLAALSAFQKLRDYFPNRVTVRGRFPALSDQRLFDDGVRELVSARGLAALFSQGGVPPELRGWLTKLQDDAAKPAPPRPSPTVAWPSPDDVQGNVIDSYVGMTHGCMVLLHARDGAALHRLLTKYLERVTTQAKGPSGVHGKAMNIALTYEGLQRLGLPDSTLALFPKEFREGMAARAGLLGDVGEVNHPFHWTTPKLGDTSVPWSTVHAIITLQAAFSDHAATTNEQFEWSADHPMHDEYAGLELGQIGGLHVVEVQPLRRFIEPTQAGQAPGWQRVYEHFGFLDGLSQPTVSAKPSNSDTLDLGELLLGHADRYGHIAGCAEKAPSLFRNGTFMAVRNLKQDVAAFEAFIGANSHIPSDQLRAAVMGRSPNGAPVVGADGSASNNQFDYTTDTTGKQCPLHAHIRRANPRTPASSPQRAVPRIFRRGFSYGPRYDPADTGSQARDRGMMFVALNASLAGQYEVVQRWLNGGNVTGLFSGQADLLTGAQKPATAVHWIWHNDEWVALTPPARPLVALRWGLYGFVPSIPALRWLAASEHREQRALEARIAGRTIIDQLGRIEAQRCAAHARDAWRAVLHERTQRTAADAIWAEVVHQQCPVPTPIGSLVGHGDGVASVLMDSGTRYSVATYGQRMREVFEAELHLGMDVSKDDYQAAAPAPNDYIFNITFKDAHQNAIEYADEQLKAWPERPDGSKVINLEQVTLATIGKLAQHYFDAPKVDGLELLSMMKCFLTTSRYIFLPDPDPALRELAIADGAEIVTRYQAQPVKPAAPSLAAALLHAPDKHGTPNVYYRDNPIHVRTALIGATSGFVAATAGSFLQACHVWLETDAFWTLRQESRDGKPLRDAIIATMKKAPVPDVVHRQDLAASPRCPRVVVGLGAAANDNQRSSTGIEAWHWLFGGAYKPGGSIGQHACPGVEMALGTMSGIATALMSLNGLVKGPLPLTLTWK